MKKLKEEKLMSSEFYLRGFEAGKKKMIKEFKEMIDKKIRFNKLWLENKSFKGKERDMLNSFQSQLEELKEVEKT